MLGIVDPRAADVDALAFEAERAARDGDRAAAARLYLEAARLEEEILAATPPEQKRSTGVLAVSAAALYAKAGAGDDAGRIALKCLRDGGLPTEARDRLRQWVPRMPLHAVSARDQVRARFVAFPSAA
jgi:hypothetical protein